MLFWIVSSVLVVATLAAILLPMFRASGTTHSDSAYDASIYKRQLVELDQDLESGLISQDQAKAARAEIARRLLAADEQAETEASMAEDQGLTKNGKIAIAVVAALLVPTITYVVYLKNGVPGMPDQPFLGRCDNVPEEPHTNAEVNAVIDCLAIRMASEPEAEGLSLLARSYLTQNRFEEAADAYAEAIKIAGPQPALLEGLGLAVIFANNGIVTDMAKDAFALALKSDQSSIWSKFYLAEYEYQQGRKSEAVSAWIDLLATDQGNDRFREMVDGRIRNGLATIAGEEGLDPNQHGVGASQSSPTLSEMSDEERLMIEGMVEGLAKRLEAEPEDLDGWLKLIRSYTVMGETTKARQAMETATVSFLTDREALETIVALGEELGLTSGPKLQLPDLAPPQEGKEMQEPSRD